MNAGVIDQSTRRGFRGRKRKIQARPREVHEEHFILRVQNPDLIARINRALNEDSKSDDSETEDSSKEPTEELNLRLVFAENHQGKLIVNEEEFPVKIGKLPTAVESFKTLDDLHCVKLSKVNQILIVGEDESLELDGVTPPFTNARDRLFKPMPEFSKEEVALVEEELLSIFEGWAPAGWKFIDSEEQCVLENGRLVWKPL
eukprot:g6189.t1